MMSTMKSAPTPFASPAPPPERDSIVKNLAHYTPSVFFRSVVGVFNVIIRPKLLTPDWLGIWSLLNVIPSYTRYLHLGSRDYMRFTVPQLVIQGKQDEAARVESSVFWGSLTPSLAVSLALILLAVFGNNSFDIRIGLGAMALLVVLTCLYEYHATVMKAHQLFRDLSRGMYLRNASQLLLSVVLMSLFGLYGLFVAVPLSQALGLFYLYSRSPCRRPGRFSWRLYGSMVNEGLPLALFAFLMTLMVTSGRLIVAAGLSREDVGYYALAAMALNGMLTFPGAAREVVEPRIMEQADAMHRPEILNRYLYQPLVLNACYLPLIIIPLYFMLPPFLRSMLPRYAPGIPALQIILLGFYFLAVFYPLRGIIVACKLQRLVAVCMVFCISANVGLSLLALRLNTGITGVATANTVSYAVLLIVMVFLLARFRGIRFPLKKIWPVWSAFPLLCISIWASQTWIAPRITNEYFSALLQSGLLVFAGFCLITLAGQKISILRGISPLAGLKAVLKKPSKP
jgi:O-antigen/teichoic acid export membrane protein